MKFDFLNKLTKFSPKKGFTLAELMIVLAVLAVIGAVLMPAVFNSMPDENKLKFKKGYYTLKRTIDALVNSAAYQATEGNFGEVDLPAADSVPAYTTDLSKSKAYFCVQFSEMLNTTKTECDEAGSGYIHTQGAGLVATDLSASNLTKPAAEGTLSVLDQKCAAFMATTDNANIVTQDGVYWGMPYDNFSAQEQSGTVTTGPGATLTGYSNVPAYYAVVCMDVDGPGGEKPFAFGIRRDGKVIAGGRAQEWLKEGTTTVVPEDNE